VARNPLAELMQMASEIADARSGRVKIPGFYKDVEPLSKREASDFLKSGFSVQKFMKDHQLKSIRTKDPLDVMKRIWALPTFEVHGLVGGYSGPGVKTVIPPRGELKCTVRLVPRMKGDQVVRLVKSWVKKHWPDVQVDAGSAAPAYKAVTSGPYAEAATKAIKFAFGKDPVFVREGGTIGAVVSMEQQLKAPVVFMGLSLPEHGYHAPNENFDWGQAGGGMVAFAKMLDEVSAIPRGKARAGSRRTR
jgi:acetylornithine deacetylase/succinyl-diaminopimelate desuccinylase-like protein